MRASDADREKVAQLLRDSASDGRLDMDELDERLDKVYAARTFGELRALTRDLPVAAPAPSAPVVQNGAPAHWHYRARTRKFATIAVLLIAIWALTGAGYFWPVWPLLWFAFFTLRSRHRIRSRTAGTYV
jgi:hypothetical protein